MPSVMVFFFGGMGDVLSGIIGALLGQGLGPYDAARFAALSLASTGCFENWDGRPHPF